MREGARFGNFEFDPTNRLDVLDKKQEIPGYVKFAREIRSALRESVEKEGWPACPQGIGSVEDFFNSAKNTVTQRWQEFAAPVFNKECISWAQGLDDEKLKETLVDSNKMETGLKLNYFGNIEELREQNQDAWRSLTLTASERQLAETVLLRRWLKEMPDSNLEKMKVTRGEMELLLDAGALLGKYVDQAYVKQIELADTPGGSKKTKLGERKGAEYIYDVYTSTDPTDKTVEKMSYSEVFSFEFPRIMKRMLVLAEKCEKLSLSGQLPESYKRMPEFLRKMADVYGTSDKRITKLDEMNDELNALCLELAQEGCPLMIIPQGSADVAKEANKVDVELRIGFITEEMRKWENEMTAFEKIGQKIVDKNVHVLDEHYQIPHQAFNYQPLAFGPNLTAVTRGETGEDFMVTHVNPNIERAREEQIPSLRKVFPRLKFKDAEFNHAAVAETALHEIGHGVISPENDDKVEARLGRGATAEILDEYKAEVVGMHLVREKYRGKNKNLEALKRHFTAKLGTMLGYLGNKDDDKYYQVGAAMAEALLRENVIAKDYVGYTIQDFEKGVQVLADMGKEVLNEYYLNEKAGKPQVAQAVKAIKEKARDERVVELVEFLKSN